MEQTSNNASAVLNMGGTLSSTATTITITSGVNVPSGGTFRALIESEIIWVTAVTGSNWTVVRGAEGTTAASHADGLTIYIILTAEAMDRIVSVQEAGTETSNRRILNFLAPFTVADDSTNKAAKIGKNPLVVANGTFTWSASGNSHSESIDLSSFSLTQTMDQLGIIVRCIQPNGSNTYADGYPNYTSGEVWALGESGFGRTDQASTGVPDTLDLHFGKLISVGASGYNIIAKWWLIDLTQ